MMARFPVQRLMSLLVAGVLSILQLLQGTHLVCALSVAKASGVSAACCERNHDHPPADHLLAAKRASTLGCNLCDGESLHDSHHLVTARGHLPLPGDSSESCCCSENLLSKPAQLLRSTRLTKATLCVAVTQIAAQHRGTEPVQGSRSVNEGRLGQSGCAVLCRFLI